MKYKSALSILFLYCLIAVFACKKTKHDDGITEQNIEQVINGGDIFRYQMVSIETGSTVLSKEEYTGTMGNTTISLHKADDNRLVFALPGDVAPGKNELLIPALDNMRIGYNVKETALTQSAEATIEPLLSGFTDFAAEQAGTPDAEAVQSSLNTVVQIFEHANAEQKAEMARTYLANKELFDAVFAEPETSEKSISSVPVTAAAYAPKTKSKVTDLLLFGTYSNYVIVMGTSATAAYFAQPYSWHTAVFIGAAVVCAYKARSTFLEIIDITWNNVTIKFNNLLDDISVQKAGSAGKVSTLSADALTFQDDVAGTVPFHLQARTLQESDRDSSVPVFQTFFSNLDEVRSFKTKINNAISWCNEHIPFSSFGLLDIETVPENAPLQSVVPPPDILSKLSFSIDDPNLQLEDVSLTEEGELSIKIKITGTTTETSVSSNLNYEYKDEVSSFSGSVPVVVKKQGVFNPAGTWVLYWHTYWNGIEAVHVYDYKFVCDENGNSISSEHKLYGGAATDDWIPNNYQYTLWYEENTAEGISYLHIRLDNDVSSKTLLFLIHSVDNNVYQYQDNGNILHYGNGDVLIPKLEKQ